MDVLSVILIAVGLAMDCFAVSIAQGLAAETKDNRRPQPVLMGALFGLFQGGMPLIGYFAGVAFSVFFKTYAPWIALVLLLFIGGKMIWEGIGKEEKGMQKADWSVAHLLVLAVATSIDALATGVIFIPHPQVVWTAVSVIGITSLVFSLIGYLIGKYLGKRFKVNVTLIGGLILVAIGLKIWIEGVCL